LFSEAHRRDLEQAVHVDAWPEPIGGLRGGAANESRLIASVVTDDLKKDANKEIVKM
jgi:hypothetical protein